MTTASAPRTAAAFSRMDVFLVLTVAIWGANYSVIKHAFAEMPPQPFNALRLAVASSTFFLVIRLAQARAKRTGGRVSSVFYTPAPLTRQDRLDLLVLGIIGHLGYQTSFIWGVSLTTASNAALLIGTTPVFIAIASALLGREKIGALHWVGAAISLVGIYIVVGRGAEAAGATLRGDLLIMVSVACWTTYTIAATRLVARHSPVYVTGTSMQIGAIPYFLIMLPQVLRVDWSHVGAWTWLSVVFSALFALCFGYSIWYAGVQRLGPTRTSTYSNLVPVVGMIVAALWLREAITPMKLAGAAAVIGGIFLTRLGRRAMTIPPEE
jgi:drug/metabolite transporter (DMT)-like permease